MGRVILILPGFLPTLILVTFYLLITIWRHKPLKTSLVVLVTFSLQSADTSHWKQNESFWWHTYYNLVIQAIENKLSRSGDIPNTVWWHKLLKTSFVVLVTFYLLITIWRHKPLKTSLVVLVTFSLQSADTSHWKQNESFWWHTYYNLVIQAIENKLSRSGDIPNTVWWHKLLKTSFVVLVTFYLLITIWRHKPLKTSLVVLVTFSLQSADTSHWKQNESFWWHTYYNLVIQAIENKLSRSGDIPNTVWWHKLLKTSFVVLVTSPLQSGDTSHWKRVSSFWWHPHYNLVTQAIENELSRSGDIIITICWHKLLKTNWVVLVTYPLQSGDTSHWKRNESFWWHPHYNLVTQAIENELSRSGDIPITIWWHKPLKTEWVILVTFPLQSGDTNHWKRVESFWWHSHYNISTQAIENGMSRMVASRLKSNDTSIWNRMMVAQNVDWAMSTIRNNVSRITHKLYEYCVAPSQLHIAKLTFKKQQQCEAIWAIF